MVDSFPPGAEGEAERLEREACCGDISKLLEPYKLPCCILFLGMSLAGEVLRSCEERKRSQTTFSLQQVLVDQIEWYQQEISPELHQRLGVERICRYEPSCSAYAKEAIIKNGALLGSLQAGRRLLRCNPLSLGGYDPITLNETREHFKMMIKVYQNEGWYAALHYDYERTKTSWSEKLSLRS